MTKKKKDDDNDNDDDDNDDDKDDNRVPVKYIIMMEMIMIIKCRYDLPLTV